MKIDKAKTVQSLVLYFHCVVLFQIQTNDTDVLHRVTHGWFDIDYIPTSDMVPNYGATQNPKIFPRIWITMENPSWNGPLVQHWFRQWLVSWLLFFSKTLKFTICYWIQRKQHKMRPEMQRLIHKTILKSQSGVLIKWFHRTAHCRV